MEHNPFSFFKYLQMYKNQEIISPVNIITNNSIKSNDYYQYLSLKNYIAELIYNGIRLFPDICEYTITCKNNIGITSLVFTNFNELAADKHPCMAKLYSNKIYPLTCHDIKDLYMFNRYHSTDDNIINKVVLLLLYTDGWDPVITTSYKINPSCIKNAMK